MKASNKGLRVLLILVAFSMAQSMAGPATTKAGTRTVIEFNQQELLSLGDLAFVNTQLAACGITFTDATHFINSLPSVFTDPRVHAGTDEFGIATTNGCENSTRAGQQCINPSAMTIHFSPAVSNLKIKWVTTEGAHINFRAHIAGTRFECGEGHDTNPPFAGDTEELANVCPGELDSVIISNTTPGRIGVGQISFDDTGLPCPAGTPPPRGRPLAIRTDVPGSLLIFPEFNISPLAVTQIRISDIQNPALGGTSRVHLNYICPGVGGACAEVDAHKQTTFHGTIVLDVATELGGPGGAPCTKGFLIAFAEDAAHHPISANQLIGSYRISETDADDAEAVNAIAVQSLQLPGTQLGTIDATGELVLSFGLAATLGVTADYVALPWILYSDFQAVNTLAVPPKRTELIVLTPSIKSGLANPQAQVGVHAWNQFGDEFSTTLRFTCWAEYELEGIAGFFNAAVLGTPYGSLQLKAVTAGGYSPTLLGVIRETGPGPTLRRLYHVGLRSTSYGPDPDTAPPGP